MTGQEARDDEREALIDRMRRASTAIYVATEAVVADDISAMLREAADLLVRKHPEPGAPAQVALSVQSRRSGKTQRMIDALLAQANERGIAVEIIEAEHPKPEITEARVDALAKSWLNYDGPLEEVDVWGDRDEWLTEIRAKSRAALEAALRVPVGEGEQ